MLKVKISDSLPQVLLVQSLRRRTTTLFLVWDLTLLLMRLKTLTESLPKGSILMSALKEMLMRFIFTLAAMDIYSVLSPTLNASRMSQRHMPSLVLLKLAFNMIYPTKPILTTFLLHKGNFNEHPSLT